MKIPVKCIKDTIVWTKNQDMEFISGKMVGFTKEISKMIYAMGLVSYWRETNVSTVDIGKMVSKQINKELETLEMYYLIIQCRRLLQRHHLKFITEKLVVHKSWQDMKGTELVIILSKGWTDKGEISQHQREKLSF